MYYFLKMIIINILKSNIMSFFRLSNININTRYIWSIRRINKSYNIYEIKLYDELFITNRKSNNFIEAIDSDIFVKFKTVHSILENIRIENELSTSL
jgi:hypothetical protein